VRSQYGLHARAPRPPGTKGLVQADEGTARVPWPSVPLFGHCWFAGTGPSGKVEASNHATRRPKAVGLKGGEGVAVGVGELEEVEDGVDDGEGVGEEVGVGVSEAEGEGVGEEVGEEGGWELGDERLIVDVETREAKYPAGPLLSPRVVKSPPMKRADDPFAASAYTMFDTPLLVPTVRFDHALPSHAAMRLADVMPSPSMVKSPPT
jgi:hypothetical protein